MARRKGKYEDAYAKERKRINQFIRRAEKRGFIFDENILPAKPKRVRAESVRRLAALTPERLYKHAIYAGEATQGEVVKGTKGAALERSLRSKKAAETRKAKAAAKKKPVSPTETIPGLQFPDNVADDGSFFDRVVITRFREHVSNFNERAEALLKSWLDRVIAQFGVHDTAVMLEDAAQDGHVVTYKIVYDTDKMFGFIADMMDYLPEMTEWFKTDFMEAMEMEEDFGEP